MNRRIIFIVIIVIAVAAGAYWYMNKGFKMPTKAPTTPAPAPAPTPMPAPAPTPTPAMTQEPAMSQEPVQMEEPVGSHPLAGDKFLVTGNDQSAVIVPTEADNRFKIDRTGARTSEMMVRLEPIEGADNTYFMFSVGLSKYIKYSNNGFGYRSSKPTTYHYKIKFTPVGDNYAMSYINNDGKEYFFGYDGDKMKSDASVTEIISTGLVNIIDSDVTGFILPGNFGSNPDNFREYGPAEDDEAIADVQGCLRRLNEVDFDEEYKESVLSVAYNKEAEAPCRAYPQSDSYSYKEGATGWVTTCVDKTKDIKQGCLL